MTAADPVCFSAVLGDMMKGQAMQLLKHSTRTVTLQRAIAELDREGIESMLREVDADRAEGVHHELIQMEVGDAHGLAICPLALSRHSLRNEIGDYDASFEVIDATSDEVIERSFDISELFANCNFDFLTYTLALPVFYRLFGEEEYARSLETDPEKAARLGAEAFVELAPLEYLCSYAPEFMECADLLAMPVIKPLGIGDDEWVDAVVDAGLFAARLLADGPATLEDLIEPHDDGEDGSAFEPQLVPELEARQLVLALSLTNG